MMEIRWVTGFESGVLDGNKVVKEIDPKKKSAWKCDDCGGRVEMQLIEGDIVDEIFPKCIKCGKIWRLPVDAIDPKSLK